ncbi:zinc finger protein, putative [Ixodes scapularis]|uniref:Zinc finger protein, putative n=1 Tax=Ixodes scapularis TaxID=6945 RepID=B7PGK7_IXOSC|nr:zinc finger protein, putative [Ixodes scapularis]|eukprot:XP_002400907.1 zinc finger protein, putative [Ixodes scapularis]
MALSGWRFPSLATQVKRLGCPPPNGRCHLLPLGASWGNSAVLAAPATFVSGVGFRCEQCPYVTPKQAQMTFHLRSHAGLRVYECAVCRLLFQTQSHLNTHMHTHTGDKPFACTLCSATFRRKVGLVEHMRGHTGEMPFTCGICKSAFVRKGTLLDHMKTHTGERTYKCNWCPQVFRSRVAKHRHTRKTHDL